jgi:FAD/FMN-containing dehydrogenase
LPHGYTIITTANTVLRQIKRIAETLTMMNGGAAPAVCRRRAFWAIRGGGGNFGVVTLFEFALHPVGPEVLTGLLVFPYEQAKQVLTRYRDFVDSMPDELSVWSVLRKAPPLPFLAPEMHGKDVVIFALCYVGDIEHGQRAIAALRRIHRGPALQRMAKNLRPAARAGRAQLLEIA